jgi:hypothetical protein
MRHQITFHDDYIETKTWGDASPEGFRRIFEEFTGDPRWRPGMPALADHRELKFSKIASFDQMSRIASMHAQNREILGDIRIALVVASSEERLWVDLWRTIANYYKFPVVHGVFYDKETALLWLLQEKAAKD